MIYRLAQLCMIALWVSVTTLTVSAQTGQDRSNFVALQPVSSDLLPGVYGAELTPNPTSKPVDTYPTYLNEEPVFTIDPDLLQGLEPETARQVVPYVGLGLVQGMAYNIDHLGSVSARAGLKWVTSESVMWDDTIVDNWDWNFRAEVELQRQFPRPYIATVLDADSGLGLESVDAETGHKSIFLNSIIEIARQSRVIPYVGFGFGYSWREDSFYGSNGQAFRFLNEKAFVGQAVAGFDFRVSPSLDFGVGLKIAGRPGLSAAPYGGEIDNIWLPSLEFALTQRF